MSHMLVVVAYLSYRICLGLPLRFAFLLSDGAQQYEDLGIDNLRD